MSFFYHPKLCAVYLKATTINNSVVKRAYFNAHSLVLMLVLLKHYPTKKIILRLANHFFGILDFRLRQIA
jgi:hypothetical protein